MRNFLAMQLKLPPWPSRVQSFPRFSGPLCHQMSFPSTLQLFAAPKYCNPGFLWSSRCWRQRLLLRQLCTGWRARFNYGLMRLTVDVEGIWKALGAIRLVIQMMSFNLSEFATVLEKTGRVMQLLTLCYTVVWRSTRRHDSQSSIKPMTRSGFFLISLYPSWSCPPHFHYTRPAEYVAELGGTSLPLLVFPHHNPSALYLGCFTFVCKRSYPLFLPFWLINLWMFMGRWLTPPDISFSIHDAKVSLGTTMQVVFAIPWACLTSPHFRFYILIWSK